MGVVIVGLAVAIDQEAVVVRAEPPLRAVSTAIVGGGLGAARSIVNLHVPRGFRCEESERGVRSLEGDFVTGTSSDAIVVAATGRGPRCRFGGPVSELGWLVARAVTSAMDAAVSRWIAEHR